MEGNKSKTSYLNDAEKELFGKAEKIMMDYNQATGSCICIYDSAYNPLFPGNCCTECSPEKKICPFCTKFRQEGENSQETFPCHDMHINAIKEAHKKGGAHIYQCGMGLLFWTSPIYTNGSFSGAIRGSGFFTEKQKTVDIFSNADNTLVMCNNEITQEEFKERVNSYPQADDEKIQSLAEMMQICAESLSSGSEDYHEILRRRSEQQETIGKIIEELKKKYPENAQKPGYSLEKEKILISTLRRGDPVETKSQLNELLAMLFFFNSSSPYNSSGSYSYSQEQFRFIQLRVTELIVLFSRTEISPGKSGSLSMETNSLTLRLVQEAKTVEELTDILHLMVDRVSNMIASFRGIPHAAALRKAEAFILENFTKKISLKEIAAIAGLSPPYFSTIFKEEMGENLSKYLNRLRVEKASRLLLETDMSLSEIAACCCFEDQSWFSKIFKAYTGISPGKYRNQGGGTVRNIGENNLSQDFAKLK